MPKMLKQFLLIILICVMGCNGSGQESPIVVGDSLYQLGKYSDALDQYQSLTDDPIALKKTGQLFAAIGNADMAIASYQEALQLSPSDNQARYELGKLLLRNNKPVEALEIFNDLLDLNGDIATYYYYRAESRQALNQTDSAIIDYDQALKLQPSYRAARIELIGNLIKTRRSFKAIAAAEKGLEDNPNDIKINSLLGQAYYHAKLYTKSVEVFNKLFDLGNDTEFNRRSLALSYLGDAEWQLAADNFEIYIDQYDEKDSNIWFQLARAYYRLKEYDKAVDAMEYSILFKRPAIDQEYLQLSTIWANKGDLEMAFNYIKLASQEAPESEIIAYQLVLAADNYFKDKQTIANYYERFVEKFGKDSRYGMSAAARLSDLKKQLFMSAQN